MKMQKYILVIIVLNGYFNETKMEAIQKKSGVIYVLIWTSGNPFPGTFITDQNCEYQNCFVTEELKFNDIRIFDVILFDIRGLYIPDTAELVKLPPRRFINQHYVLFGTEPAEKYPVDEKLNNFFNLTWTYRLDSDAIFPFIEARDKNDRVVGPKLKVPWIHVNFMKPTSNYIKNKLRNKNIAAVWIVSNCDTNNNRKEFVDLLAHELKKYGHKVDIFGRCGDYFCSKNRMDECFSAIENNYYFYLAFESVLGKDYVTDKVLHGLEHFAVPVVHGSADYFRFLPPGSYLNARELGPRKLAKEMNVTIADKRKYFEYFKWHRYYSFHSTAENEYRRQYCEFCTLLNNVRNENESSFYPDLPGWWNNKDTPENYGPITEKSQEQNEFVDIMSQLYDRYFDK